MLRLNFREDGDVSGKSGHLLRDLTVAALNCQELLLEMARISGLNGVRTVMEKDAVYAVQVLSYRPPSPLVAQESTQEWRVLFPFFAVLA